MDICRVCLNNSDEMISLKSTGAESSSILHMLSEFTIKNAEERLSQYICQACIRDLDVAYEFKRKYEESIVKFIRHNSYVDDHLTLDEGNFEEKYKINTIAVEHQNKPEEQPQNQLEILSCCTIPDEHHLYPAPIMETNNDENGIIPKVKLKMCSSSTIHENQSLATVELMNIDQYDNETQSTASQLNLNQCEERPQMESANDLNNDHNKNGPQVRLKRLSNSDQNSYQPQEAESATYSTDGHESYNKNWPRVRLTKLSFSDKLSDHLQLELAKPSNCYRNEDRQADKSPDCSHPKTELKDDLNCDRHVDRILRSKIQKTVMNQEFPLTKQVEGKLVGNSKCDQQGDGPNLRPKIHETVMHQKFQPKLIWSRNFNRKLTQKNMEEIYTHHHHRIRPFRCDICYRYFKTKGHIKTHRILHTQAEREIKCSKCALRFLTKPHFRNHKCFQ